jgi:outer membrane protein OmpA-like peptidoglycan-associated protein
MPNIQKISFFILFSFFVERTNGQNLVANNSFEDLNICYEFNANCSPAAWFVVASRNPLQIKPVSGIRFLSFTFDNLSDHLIKTYPYTKVLCPLLPGSKYKLGIWINSGDFDFTHLDVLLSKGDPSRIKKSMHSPLFTFEINKMDILDKRADGWILLQRIFSVDEISNFLLLGNLSNWDYSKRDRNRAKKYQGNMIYSIDDIYLTNLDSTSNKCPQFDDVIADLYRETHRHTPFIYLDGEQRTPRVREITRNVDIKDSIIKSFSKIDTLSFPDFLFKTASSEISPQYYKILDSVVNLIQNKKLFRIDINGYTDDIGSDEENEKLSLERSQSVKKYILGNLPALKDILYPYGYGKGNPKVPNINDNNRAKNRRVEILIFEE